MVSHLRSTQRLLVTCAARQSVLGTPASIRLRRGVICLVVVGHRLRRRRSQPNYGTHFLLSHSMARIHSLAPFQTFAKADFAEAAIGC